MKTEPSINEASEPEEVLSKLKKACRYCATVIPDEASVCFKCNQHQKGWKNHLRLDHMGQLLAQIIALAMMIIAYQNLQETRKERVDAENANREANVAKNLALSTTERMEQLEIRFVGQINSADEKLKSLDSTLEKASTKLSELHAMSEFYATVSDAQNDNRTAFKKLCKWGGDPSDPFSSRAQIACLEIFRRYEQPSTYSIENAGIWDAALDKSKITTESIRKTYYEEISQPVLRPGLIIHVWNMKNLTIKDKLKFFIEIIEHDDSIRAAAYAGLFFAKGAGLDLHPLEREEKLKWWKKNEEKLK